MNVDPVVEQIKKDDDLYIPNPGDSRQMIQKGRIQSKDGQAQEVDLRFVRTRNKEGGVDVVCHAPKFRIKGKNKTGG